MIDRVDTLAFAKASARRVSVLVALRDWPKTTGQVAASSAVSMPHASRNLRELEEYGLVECATPDRLGRGRLYRLTPDGEGVTNRIVWEQRRPIAVPMLRATHPKAWYQVLRARFGDTTARQLFAAAGAEGFINASPRSWIPLRPVLELLDAMEARFGDGTHGFIRSVAGEALKYFPSARRYLMRALPMTVIVEMVPAAYLREFNHGRMEVDVSEGRAHMMHYDWLSSHARCAAWLGSYEGSLAARKLSGTVEKTECILEGDEFCGYLVRWSSDKGAGP